MNTALHFFLTELLECNLGYQNTHGFVWVHIPLSGRSTPKVPLFITVLPLHEVSSLLCRIKPLPGFSGRIYHPAGQRATGNLI